MSPEALGPLDLKQGHEHGMRRGARLPRSRSKIPEKVEADRMGDAMGGTFEQTTMKHETTEASTGPIETCVYPKV